MFSSGRVFAGPIYALTNPLSWESVSMLVLGLVPFVLIMYSLIGNWDKRKGAFSRDAIRQRYLILVVAVGFYLILAVARSVLGGISQLKLWYAVWGWVDSPGGFEFVLVAFIALICLLTPLWAIIAWAQIYFDARSLERRR